MEVRIGCRHVAVAALAWLSVVTAISPVSSQPSPEQQNAIRGHCRSDYMSNCASVKPGGIEALQCLQRNVAKLSPACQSAVNAVTPKPAAPQQAKPAAPPAPAPATAAAPAAAPPAAAPPAAPVRTTTAPAQAKPAAAPPPARQAAKPPAKPAPTLAAAPADVPPIAAPSPAQQSAIRFACRADYMAACRGVPPGGAEALACLQRAPRLSEDCRTALAAMSGDAPTSRANTPTGEPRRPIGPIRRAIRDRMMNQ